MPLIEWTAPALADLESIEEWVVENIAPRLALEWLAEIRARARFLEDFPRGGRPLPDGTRVLLVRPTPYLLQYRLFDGRVQVLRVRHERTDWLLLP